MNTGDKVVCIDDTGWLIPDPGYEHLAPKKGNIYVVRDTCIFGSIRAISLVGGNAEDFYRACRFRPLAATKQKELEHSAQTILLNCRGNEERP